MCVRTFVFACMEHTRDDCTQLLSCVSILACFKLVFSLFLAHTRDDCVQLLLRIDSLRMLTYPDVLPMGVERSY
jgi:hypothetical protein